MPFRLLLALLASLSLVTAALAGEPVFPPGSRVGLIPAPGMTPGKSFQGFEDRSNRVVLLVSEVSAQTYERIAEEFTSEAIRRSGMEELSRETLPLSAGEGLLVVTRQGQNGTALRKWALLARNEQLTVTVIAVVPEAARDAYPDTAMRTALSSVVVRAKLTADEMLSVLPYRLGELGGFRLMRASPDGTAVMTFGSQDTSLPAEQPYFMITPRAVEPPAPEERERFAQRAMAGFLQRPNVRIVNSEQMRIGGVPGHQIVAVGQDERTGDELVMVQWLRFGPGVVQMFGMARRDKWDDAFARMRTVRDGFGPK